MLHQCRPNTKIICSLSILFIFRLLNNQFEQPKSYLKNENMLYGNKQFVQFNIKLNFMKDY